MSTWMNMLSRFTLVSMLFCALACPAQDPGQPTKLVVTQGHYIGYPTVAAARAALESEGLTGVPGVNGDVSFVKPDKSEAWTFAGKDDPAYPSAVRYVYTNSDGVLHAELTFRCEASVERCEKFRSDILEHLSQLSKKISGDPSANCWVQDDKMQCGGTAPDRKEPD